MYPETVSTSVTQLLDMVFMGLECLAVPAFWLWETGQNFPELTSTRNNVLGR